MKSRRQLEDFEKRQSLGWPYLSPSGNDDYASFGYSAASPLVGFQIIADRYAGLDFNFLVKDSSPYPGTRLYDNIIKYNRFLHQNIPSPVVEFKQRKHPPNRTNQQTPAQSHSHALEVQVLRLGPMHRSCVGRQVRTHKEPHERRRTTVQVRRVILLGPILRRVGFRRGS